MIVSLSQRLALDVVLGRKYGSTVALVPNNDASLVFHIVKNIYTPVKAAIKTFSH